MTAEQMITVPSIMLIVVGILGVLAGVAQIIFAVTGVGNDPLDPPTKEDRIVEYVWACVSLLWGGFVAFGGFQMKSFGSRSLAIAGAVVAMVPLNVCCLFGLPVGIWAITILNKPEVQESFS